MNYIELHTAFWKLHDERQFNVTEIALFGYLVKWNNYLFWKKTFERRNSLVCADLDISKPTLRAAMTKLRDRGVIGFRTKIGNPNVEYWLVEPKVEKNFAGKYAGSDPGLVVGLVAGSDGGYYPHNININNTKLNKTVYKAFAHLSMDTDEFDFLIDAGFSKDEIDDILKAIENYKDNKKYSSLYLTADKWLKRNAAKKVTPVAGKKDTQAEKDYKKRVNKTLDAFELYKGKRKFTDWDNVVYDFLYKKGLIGFAENDNRLPGIIELENAGRVPEAKQIALMAYFHDMAEVGRELKDLLKN